MEADHYKARMPWSMLVSSAGLVALGWLGIGRYEELSGGSGHFLRQQIVWSLLAAAALVLASLPGYRKLGRWSFGLFALAAALLLAVYFFPPVNGARRWLRLGSLSFQPSEIAKIACVLAAAECLADWAIYGGNWRLLKPLGLTLLSVLLILPEPDLGTAMIFPPVMFVMFITAGVPRGHLAALFLAGLLAMPVLWTGMSLEQRSRVTSLFDQAGPGETATGDGYHLRQAKQMLALGGTWGSLVTGPAVDDPAAYHLPEARSDFVFCVLKERLGLPGVALVLGLYAIIVSCGFQIAAAARELRGRLIAVGLTSLLAVQVLINTGMNVGLLPITGLSLPLVSYGGSSLVSNGLLLGLLVNVGVRPGYEVMPRPFRHLLAPHTARPRYPHRISR